MRILEPVKPVEIFAEQEVHEQASKAATYRADFSVDTQFQIDLGIQQMMKDFTELRTLYFDCIDCNNDVTIVFEATRQRLTLRAGSWGYVPVAAASSKMGFTITGTSPDVFNFLLHNYDIQAIISEAVVATPGDINFTTSPVLLGRYSAGAGPGQEIPVLSPFVISATDIRVQAAAQFNVFGRRTAGAGAMEDSTRTQLNIPGLELANLFSNNNTFSFATGGTGLANASIIAQGTDPGAAGALIIVYHNSVSPAAGDTSRIRFFFNNDAATALRFGAFDCVTTGVGAGAEGASLNLGVIQAGVFSTRLVVTGGVYVFGAADPGAGSFASAPTGFIRHGVFTVGTLPAAATAGAGARAAVTDSLAPAYLVAIAAGGAAFSGVLSTGAAWLSA